MKQQLLTTLENSRHYTLGVASAMPGEAYSFRPANGIWNFGELMQHIAYGIHWWEENYIKGRKTDWNPPAVATDRPAVLSSIEKAYESLEKTIQKTTSGEEVLAGFHATMDHITHHRGQASLYLRCKGITPPEYEY